MTERSSFQRIEDIGFRRCGHWETGKTVEKSPAIKLVLTEHASATNALYAFVSEGQVLYIGKTTQRLRKRLYGYQNPRSTQATNLRGNKTISDALSAGKLIEIYVLPDHGLLRFGGFHLNLAAALEDSLINDLRPLWNKRFGREDAIAKARAAKVANGA